MPHSPAGGDALVFLVLDAGATGQVAGTLDVASGLLSPARRTWTVRPVVAERRAYVNLKVHRTGVDLSLERLNGWRRAVVPLIRLQKGHEASQSAELFQALAAVLERHGPRDPGRAIPRLAAQGRHLAEGNAVRSSPLTALPGGGAFGFLATDWS